MKPVAKAGTLKLNYDFVPPGKRLLSGACLALSASPFIPITTYAGIVTGEMDVRNVKLELVVKNGGLYNIAAGGPATMNIASNIGVSVHDVKQSVFITGNVVNKSEGAGRKSTVNIGVISCEGEFR